MFPSEPSSPAERLWFWPKSTTHGRVQANPTRQYMLSVSGFPPHFGTSGRHRPGLHGCCGGKVPGVLPGSVREDAGDLPDACPRSGVDILRYPLGAGWMQAVSLPPVGIKSPMKTVTLPVQPFKNKGLSSPLPYRRSMVQQLVSPPL